MNIRTLVVSLLCPLFAVACDIDDGTISERELDAAFEDDLAEELADDCDGPACEFTAFTCGDGELNAGEQCDDGNSDAGDGCEACRVRPVTDIFGSNGAPAGDDCEGPACKFAAFTCGDGELDAGEQCDDGNGDAGDGCEACRIRPATDIFGSNGAPSGDECDGPACELAAFTCGDGALDAGEQCDDGNSDAGDGCEACRIRPATDIFGTP